MRSAETSIPGLATQAGRAAHQRAMAQAGHVVMKSASGQLVDRQASGQTVVIKALPATTPARTGMVLKRVKKLNKKAIGQ
jgi:hypothetical protein